MLHFEYMGNHRRTIQATIAAAVGAIADYHLIFILTVAST